MLSRVHSFILSRILAHYIFLSKGLRYASCGKAARRGIAGPAYPGSHGTDGQWRSEDVPEEPSSGRLRELFQAASDLEQDLADGDRNRGWHVLSLR